MEMKVKELHKKLSELIEQGHADTRVIANISFTSPWDLKKGEEVSGFYLTHLNDVYYQSGDIELGFSQDDEEEQQSAGYFDEDDCWHGPMDGDE